MSKVLKRMLASQLKDAIESDDNGGLLMIDAGNMTVDTAEAFRADLREQAGGAKLRIIHNRTARVAFRDLYQTESQDLGELDALLQGPSAIVHGGGGPIAIAKVVRDWKRKHKQLVVKGAFADGEYMGTEDAAQLADMPDLTQLKGMLASAIIGSARGIAVSMTAVYGGIARCLQARIDKEDGGEDEA